MINQKKTCRAWACAVLDVALEDAESIGLTQFEVQEIVDAFFKVGDCVRPEDDDRVEKLVDPGFGGNKYRMKLRYSATTRHVRSLLIDVVFNARGQHALVLAGIFERGEGTYDDDMPRRCKGIGL